MATVSLLWPMANLMTANSIKGRNTAKEFIVGQMVTPIPDPFWRTEERDTVCTSGKMEARTRVNGADNA